MTATYMVGDVFDRMAEIPDGSVDLVLTSPPFLALRSYLPADHPDKAKEIGSEPTPAEFIDTLLALTAEWRRVLAPHGSICVELGDTYSGGSAEGSDTRNPDSQRFRGHAHGVLKGKNGNGWPLAKSMVGIPHLYHLSLAYGRNLLTGEPSPAGDWRVRNVVAWCRPNPPVGALGDKFRPATSYMTIACVSAKRYFDLDAVRTPLAESTAERGEGSPRGNGKHMDDGTTNGAHGRHFTEQRSNPGGAPPLDWWEIPTVPYSGSHYAVYPPALCERPIKAMCPQRVCTVCGEPSRRIVSEAEYIDGGGRRSDGDPEWRSGRKGLNPGEGQCSNSSVTRTTTTLGWTDCECSDDGSHWRPGVVLDPFGGSGTTGMVATGHGRDAILIDIDERNLDLARDRIGMFLEEAS